VELVKFLAQMMLGLSFFANGSVYRVSH